MVLIPQVSKIETKIERDNKTKKKSKSKGKSSKSTRKSSKSSKSSKGTPVDTLCTNKSEEDALLAFKAGITSDPKNVMSDWAAGGSVCNVNVSNWSGITCVGGQVTRLKLGTYRYPKPTI